MTEDKSTRYHRLRRRADLGGTAVAGALLLLFSVSGAAALVRALFQWVTSRTLPAMVEAPVLVLLMAATTFVLLHLVEFPFSWYQGFFLEHRYGLSRQSGARWLADHVKASSVGFALMLAGATVVFATIRWFGEAWWLVSAIGFAVAMVGLVRLAPVLLLPLFYRFKPLDRPALASRLLSLAAEARTEVGGVFEWVLSGHTRKANAALAGIGSSRRILLSDTLLSDYSDDEIEVVLAHELAHHVHRDIWRGVAVQTAILFGGFFVASRVLNLAVAPLGLQGPADPAALPLLMLAGGTWSFAVLPVVNWISRAQERAADHYALRATRNPEAFVSAMKRLSQQNLAEERPSPLVRLLFYSHPPIGERIEAARAFTET